MRADYNDTLMMVHGDVQERAFYRCRSITQLRFNNSVRVVGYYSFFENVNLETVYFEDHGVECIQGLAFAGCNMLEDVVLPDSLTEIGEGAFRDCIRLQSIVLPGCLETLGRDCFLGTRIQSVSIPSSVRVMAAAFDPRLKELRCSGRTLALCGDVQTETMVCPATATTLSGDQWDFTLTVPSDPEIAFDPVAQLKTQCHIDGSIQLVTALGELKDHRSAMLRGEIDPKQLTILYV